ncbi:farnesyltranstransferase [Candidatus Phycosocius spiralis]|uniref:Farnesyltranstransferase n=1 Tax=Candidatus Phycosocius spiralis TaxID=2815099 RepID=A0ABQ4PVD9_9PROT|nr:farnesyltranstransferase [Candidatus Phycosocius spiralis]
MNLTIRPIDAHSVSPTEALAAVLAPELAATEAEIGARMASPVGLIPDVAHHLVDAGGKRLRPLLTLAAARTCGGGGQAAVKLATAVEFIHTATLLHDDVVDGSSLRRGKRTANLIWGDKASVLVGDFLFARAFNLMVETNSLHVLDILAKAASTIAEGEVLQLATTSRGEASRSRYYQVIEAKTAALFAAACKAGAITAGAPLEWVEALATFGLRLGLAFQLVDDALDYGGLSQVLGKNTGDDFREGKATLPLIIAFERSEGDERLFWQRVLARQHRDGDIDQALSILQAHGAVEATLQEARNHIQAAKTALALLPEGVIPTLLADLADYVVDRHT